MIDVSAALMPAYRYPLGFVFATFPRIRVHDLLLSFLRKTHAAVLSQGQARPGSRS